MIEFDSQMKINEIVSKSEIIIINYYAKWCGPCKSIFAHLSEISNSFTDSITIININVDVFPDVAHEQNIRAIPTLQYFKKGELYLKESGFRTKDQLFKNVESLINIETI